MATRKIVVKGKAYWPRLFEDNRDLKGWNDSYVPMNGMYTIEVDLDAENEAILKESGSAKQKNKHGRYKFTRPHEHRFEWAAGEPKVVAPDGSRWSFEENGSIWNESEVAVHLDVYDTSGMSGTRMTQVDVLEVAAAPEREEAEEGAPF